MRWKLKKNQTGRPNSFAHIYLNRQTTSDLIALARDKESSLTTWMLYHLDKMTVKNLLEENSQRKWVLPLNMRTDPKENLSGNHSASIILNLNPGDSAKDLHLQMSKFLKNQLQWGSHLYSNMAGILGHRGTRFVALVWGIASQSYC